MKYSNIFEYICDNRFSTLIDLLSTLIGAFLGFLFGLLLYWLGNWTSRKRKKKEEEQIAYDTLKRFSILLKTLVKSSKKQNEEFNNYAEKIIKEPLNYHTPNFLATNDRNRLIESDSLELFHSFMIFENDNPNKYSDYRNIFIHADFIQKFYEDLLIQNEKHMNFSHSDFKVIRDNLLSITIRMGLIQKNIQIENPVTYIHNKEFQFLEKYSEIYLSLKGVGFTNLEPYNDRFLIPFQLEIFDNISDQNQADEISIYIATIMTRMDSVIMNTKEHATNFANLDKNEDVNSALLYLEKIIEKIEKNNKP